MALTRSARVIAGRGAWNGPRRSGAESDLAHGCGTTRQAPPRRSGRTRARPASGSSGGVTSVSGHGSARPGNAQTYPMFHVKHPQGSAVPRSVVGVPG